MSEAVGTDEGERCGRNGCDGVLVLHNPDSDGGCSCFISPPCSHCLDTRPICPVCDYDPGPAS